MAAWAVALTTTHADKSGGSDAGDPQTPILRGFQSDPSITRVGEDYYIATSTFVWQPGIRLYHSTDLATWSLIDHGLKTGEHDLHGLAAHQGIWAYRRGAPSLSWRPNSRSSMP